MFIAQMRANRLGRGLARYLLVGGWRQPMFVCICVLDRWLANRLARLLLVGSRPVGGRRELPWLAVCKSFADLWFIVMSLQPIREEFADGCSARIFASLFVFELAPCMTWK